MQKASRRAELGVQDDDLLAETVLVAGTRFQKYSPLYQGISPASGLLAVWTKPTAGPCLSARPLDGADLGHPPALCRGQASAGPEQRNGVVSGGVQVLTPLAISRTMIQDCWGACSRPTSHRCGR